MAKQKKVKLTDDQIKYGAMYLAASNLGMQIQNAKDEMDIRAGWRRCMEAHFEDGQEIDVQPELKDWEKSLRKGDTYSVGAIQKELPFLFTEATQ